MGERRADEARHESVCASRTGCEVGGRAACGPAERRYRAVARAQGERSQDHFDFPLQIFSSIYCVSCYFTNAAGEGEMQSGLWKPTEAIRALSSACRHGICPGVYSLSQLLAGPQLIKKSATYFLKLTR